MTGIDVFLEVLRASGVTHLFGNPGTTELPLNAALVDDDRFKYLFGIQEIPVVAMADGYAMASGKTGVVNVHISCGLGNAMGMLYNAHIEGTPLLVTAGHQDRRLQLGDPVLQGDVVRVAAPWTKWSYEVQRMEDLPVAVRRAIQIAHTPPTGPVFLALPVDLQMEEVSPAQKANLDLSPPHLPDRRVRPPREALKRAAEILAAAKNPAILAGSRVTEADGTSELAAVAERLGAPVFCEATPSHGRVPIRVDHPLYRGGLPNWSPETRELLKEFDVLFVVGLNLFRLYIFREPSRPLPETARLIHLDSAPYEIGKNYPPEVGLLGDPKSGLAELNELLAAAGAGGEPAQARLKKYSALREQELASLRQQIAAEERTRPMPARVLMQALARALPAHAAVVDEAITTHHNLFERLGVLNDPRAFFAHRGWALGWGLGAALGVKLAWPDRPVLGLVGDGSALYGIQALWSAAHHNIPVTFVIPNNSQYKILKYCGDVMSLPELYDPRCPGMEMTRPPVDYVGLARAFGVEAVKLSEPEQITERVRNSLAGDRPLLVEVPIAG
ncbi:MAG: thiamine pyrophosphate-binding protein [Planctomycetaceae bacterium]